MQSTQANSAACFVLLPTSAAQPEKIAKSYNQDIFQVTLTAE